MIKKKTARKGNFVIDLTGPEGNAFVLLGYVKRFGKQLEWSDEQVKAVQDKMKAGDYENLVQVFDDTFGNFVTLLR